MVRTSQQIALLAQLLGVNSLDLGTLHLFAELWLTTNETRMQIGSLVRTTSNSIKAPHVELALETLVLCLVKVFGHDIFVKLFCLVDLETILGRNPGDNIVETFNISII